MEPLAVYYDQEPSPGSMVYLAGPTRQEEGDLCWQDQLLAVRGNHHFTRSVCIPKPANGIWVDDDAPEQMIWQERMLLRATLVIFWLPRVSPGAFIEFGQMLKYPERVLLGIPEQARPALDLVIFKAFRYRIPVAPSLEALGIAAAEFLRLPMDR